MNRSFPHLAKAGATCLLFLAYTEISQGETITISPVVSYTVESLQGSTYLHREDRLYSSGYSGGATPSLTTVARMEFRIPPSVLFGLEAMEFQTLQTGLTEADNGYTYLWYYSAVGVPTSKELTLNRTGFTAKAVDGATYLSRDLLQGMSGGATSVARVENLALAITSNLGVKREIQFSEPKLVITYTPPPVDNAAAVAKLLTEPSRPFAGTSDPSIMGFEADPDGDGITNIFELWRGTSPSIPDGAPAPAVGWSGANRLPYVETNVSIEADNILLVGAEVSRDLVNWRDISASRTVVTISTSTRKVRFTDPIPQGTGGSSYFRFIATGEGRKFE